MSAADADALRTAKVQLALGGGLDGPSMFETADPAAMAALVSRQRTVKALSGRWPTWSEDAQFVAGWHAREGAL